MKTIVKITVAVFAVLTLVAGIASQFITDNTLRSVGGPIGDQAVSFKHTIHDKIEGTIYDAKTMWWDISSGKAFDSNPRVLIKFPKTLQDQFGKTPNAEPMMKKPEPGSQTELNPELTPEPAPKPEPMAEPKPEATPKSESKPEPESIPKPEMSTAPPPPPPEPKPKPKPVVKPELKP